MEIPNILTPAFLLDKEVLQRNINWAQKLCAQAGQELWPMTKTHKSTEIAKLQMAAGAQGFLAGTLQEARKLAKIGAKNIAYAYPLASEENYRFALDIAKKTRFLFSLDSIESAQMLQRFVEDSGESAEYLLIIDSGLHRFGVQPQAAGQLAKALAEMKGLRLAGISTHPGQVYACGDKRDVADCARQEREALDMAVASLCSFGINVPMVATGSTPVLEEATKNAAITVQRPGNYVFFDRTQCALGSCSVTDCALTALTTVVAHPAPELYIIDAGSKVFGLDQGAHGTSLLQGFGEVIGHPELVLTSLSEEVGKVVAKKTSNVRIGDKLRIIPNHACSMANLAEQLLLHTGNKIIGTLAVDMRR